mgnify:CR=1 FL=1
MGLEIIFLIVAIVTLLTALMVVTTPNLVHAALYLVLTLFGVAWQPHYLLKTDSELLELPAYEAHIAQA